MAGHSKWANIKHRKGKQDAKRGKVFTKIIREITVAARLGGSDLEHNPSLRLAIEKANRANMTKDTVQRAIARGAGDQSAEQMEAIRYEGYGPSGVAFIVDCLTDNRNRTVSEVRYAFAKSGGSLGTENSVAFQFDHQGHVWLVSRDEIEEDELFELVLNVGAIDLQRVGDHFLVITEATSQALDACVQCCQQAGWTIVSAELTYASQQNISVDEKNAPKIIKLMDQLDNCDDVQDVYHNAEFPEGYVDIDES